MPSFDGNLIKDKNTAADYVGSSFFEKVLFFSGDYNDLDNLPDLSDYVESQNVTTVVVLTQAEYDSIPTKDQNTLYFIKAD